MEMIFPPDYPLAPPFLRVLRPRFKFLTGHVTVGGSVCMQLLTNNGWSPANTIESVIVQVRACRLACYPHFHRRSSEAFASLT